MVGMQSSFRSEAGSQNDIEDNAMGITMEDTDHRILSQDGPRPGLHGRARIWGPNKTVQMILLTTALMG